MDARAPRLVSIGYEGRDADELLADLADADVSVLVDVRLTPLSRKPGMSKRRLAAALEHAGIRYVHLRELGNPKENRSGLRAGDPAASDLFRRKLDGDDETRALRRISELLNDDVVALLCFERDGLACHRQLVADVLAEQLPDLRTSRL